jgi:hypothetical protein
MPLAVRLECISRQHPRSKDDLTCQTAFQPVAAEERFQQVAGRTCLVLGANRQNLPSAQVTSSITGSGNGYPGDGTLLRHFSPNWRETPSANFRLSLLARVVLNIFVRETNSLCDLLTNTSNFPTAQFCGQLETSPYDANRTLDQR